jgi:hypothetical protein
MAATMELARSILRRSLGTATAAAAFGVGLAAHRRVQLRIVSDELCCAAQAALEERRMQWAAGWRPQKFINRLVGLCDVSIAVLHRR